MKKWLKIFIAVLATLVSAFILIMILVDILALDGTIELSDWLVAGCSILSMIGTVSLAVISVTQNEKANEQNQTLVKQNEVANEQNQALIKQNEELQKINDTQFKIANQKYYPVLDINHVKLEKKDEVCPNLTHWTQDLSNLINHINTVVRLNIDCIDSKTDKVYCSIVSFSITNISDAIIQEIEIYKLAASKLSSPVDTAWKPSVHTLCNGKSFDIQMHYYHNDENFAAKKNAINCTIYFKLKTITGVFFYEKVCVYAMPSFSYGVIEEINNEKIEW